LFHRLLVVRRHPAFTQMVPVAAALLFAAIATAPLSGQEKAAGQSASDAQHTVSAATPSANSSAANTPSPDRLSVATIYAHGRLVGAEPRGLTWSPDSARLTYLEGGELMELDPSTAKSRVLVSQDQLATLRAKGASEKDKDHRDRYKMASYLWAPDSKHLLFDVNGLLWVYDLKSQTGQQVGVAAASGDDPKFSPDGKAISFIREHGLSVIRLDKPDAAAIEVAAVPAASVSAAPAILNGEVDWVYEEELDVRSNSFWSPDSTHLAYLQSNESKVPEYPITDWIPTHPVIDAQRFPQPGDMNPDVRVGVVSATGGPTTWVVLPIQPGQDYIPRFGWVNAQTLWIETLTRDHKHRDLYFADAATGVAHPVLQFTDKRFFNESYDVFVADGTILLTNWTDGHNHLYRYVYDSAHPTEAHLDRQLTTGDYEVDKALRVDTSHSAVVYSSNEESPLNRSVWQVNFDGKRHRLTKLVGWHEADFSPNGAFFVDTYSTLSTPPSIWLCAVAAVSPCTSFWTAQPVVERYHVGIPQIISVKSHDGVPTLYASLLLPQGSLKPASVPLIVDAYGGPGVQDVTDQWSDRLLFDEVLARHGFAVLHADNRGMAQRGREFAQAAYQNFGAVQLEDQLTMVDAVLSQFPSLDRSRLGWWGWSWGGSFTLYAMSHSDRFRAGVSVAPVTDWRNYDSVYTERYLGLPDAHAADYERFSAVNSAANLKGHLLIAHGTGDDNVHLENTIQYIQKLIEGGRSYDLQLFPRKTHSLAGIDVRTQLFERILAHFEQYLKPESATPVASGSGQN